MRETYGYITYPLVEGEKALTLDQAITKAEADYAPIARPGRKIGIFKLVGVVELEVTVKVIKLDD